MRTRTLAVLCVVGLLPLFAGCGRQEKVAGGPQEKVVTPQQKVITLTAQDNGRTINAAVGDRVVLSLAGNVTTGYDWKIAAIDPAILQEAGDSTYKQDQAPSGMVGVGGTRTWSFNVKATGSSPLTLEYRRSFEPDSQPAAKTFTVIIKVAK